MVVQGSVHSLPLLLLSFLPFEAFFFFLQIRKNTFGFVTFLFSSLPPPTPWKPAQWVAKDYEKAVKLAAKKSYSLYFANTWDAFLQEDFTLLQVHIPWEAILCIHFTNLIKKSYFWLFYDLSKWLKSQQHSVSDVFNIKILINTIVVLALWSDYTEQSCAFRPWLSVPEAVCKGERKCTSCSHELPSQKR